MKASGIQRLISEMVEAFKYGRMVPDMMDFGKMEQPAATADSSTPKETSTKVHGSTTKLMALASIPTIMAVDTKACGSTTSNMEEVWRNGRMVQSTPVNTKMVRSKVKASSCGQIRARLKVIL